MAVEEVEDRVAVHTVGIVIGQIDVQGAVFALGSQRGDYERAVN